MATEDGYVLFLSEVRICNDGDASDAWGQTAIQVESVQSRTSTTVSKKRCQISYRERLAATRLAVFELVGASHWGFTEINSGQQNIVIILMVRIRPYHAAKVTKYCVERGTVDIEVKVPGTVLEVLGIS